MPTDRVQGTKSPMKDCSYENTNLVITIINSAQTIIKDNQVKPNVLLK